MGNGLHVGDGAHPFRVGSPKNNAPFAEGLMKAILLLFGTFLLLCMAVWGSDTRVLLRPLDRRPDPAADGIRR